MVDVWTYATQSTTWNGARDALREQIVRTFDDPEKRVIWQAICDVAKARDITVYAIAYDIEGDGPRKTQARADLSYCVSSPSHMFQAGIDELSTTFLAILSNEFRLRLTH